MNKNMTVFAYAIGININDFAYVLGINAIFAVVDIKGKSYD